MKAKTHSKYKKVGVAVADKPAEALRYRLPADDNEVELTGTGKDLYVYTYTKSLTKLGTELRLTEAQNEEFLRRTQALKI